MKKILFTSILLFLTFITNAQTLEGVWKFEKMKLFGTFIYFDDTNKDKENFIRSWIKLKESELDEDELAEMKSQVNSNKNLVYANAKDQYKYSIQFTGEKLIFKHPNKEDKMENTEADYKDDGEILKLFGGKELHGIRSFSYLLKNNKLILTEIDKFNESADKLTAFFYER